MFSVVDDVAVIEDIVETATDSFMSVLVSGDVMMELIVVVFVRRSVVDGALV